jgi:threonine dehydrogenase-like Zn-dependent dehydrogenase
MADTIVDNRAEEVPFSYVIADLLTSNLEQRLDKMKTFRSMWGVVALNLPDIEAAITLIFAGGRVRIDPGVVGKPDLIINSSSEKIISLNAISIKFGLPYYFDEAGMNVLKQLASGELRINGMFTHPILLTKLTKIMSVM